MQFRPLKQQPPVLTHPNTWWEHTHSSSSSSSSSSLPSWFLPSSLLAFLWQSSYACKHTLELLLGEPLGEALSSPLLSAFITLIVIYTVGTCLGGLSTPAARANGVLEEVEEEEEEEEGEEEEEEEEEGEEDGEEGREGWVGEQQRMQRVKKREEERSAQESVKAWQRKRLSMWEHPSEQPPSVYPPLSTVTTSTSSTSSRDAARSVGRSSGGSSRGRRKEQPGRVEGRVVELSSPTDCWWLPAERRTGSSSSSMSYSSGNMAPYAVVLVLRDCAPSEKDAALTNYKEVASSFVNESRLIFSYVDCSKHHAWLALLSLFSPLRKGGTISEGAELSHGDGCRIREGSGKEREEGQEESEGWVEVESEGMARNRSEGSKDRRSGLGVGTAAVIAWHPHMTKAQCIGDIQSGTVDVLVTRVERLLDGSSGPWVQATWPALT
ncbi:hypothetical protein CLOM_g17275 [Closterium sp. NIES-68]|nr:hypothetical protein CLOM_g17275 [Closterium sp. NIES-68]GJP72688.1 hypothetical protein CLOP_g3450 [Closterium sp. NIES-67]